MHNGHPEKHRFTRRTLLGSATALGILPVRAYSSPGPKPPVLVELFTSEGCSSCPRADALLAELDRTARPDADIIVLSEHVDYWNHLGWRDPYSAPEFSQRQRRYGDRLQLDSVYTPQMVIDGVVEVVGNDASRVGQTINAAAKEAKLAVKITPAGKSLRIEVEPLPATHQNRTDVIVAVATSRASSSVSRSENSGRRLEHVAVCRTLKRLGTLRSTVFSQTCPLPPSSQEELRVVAFAQETGQGRVLGAAMHILTPSAHS